jgi:predicted restriction endonuclease
LSGECRLCGRAYPKAFLVAAHKKKRAKCTDSEKRDIKNVMMLCCLFGCDALYESGFISVNPMGSIVRSSALPSGPVLEYALAVVKAQIEVNPAEQEYFAWHASHTFRD